MNAIILIDFGMTASGKNIPFFSIASAYLTRRGLPAAECVITMPPDLRPIRHHKFGKTPTQLVYGKDDKVITWGTGCKSSDEVKELFKKGFATRDIQAANQAIGHSSAKETEKWVSDYLYHFCCNVLDEVSRGENATKDDSMSNGI